MDELDNHGSTARDHLANERTFLAWVRTGLGVVGLGVVFEKVVDGSIGARIAGVVLALYGIAILIYALFRFSRVERALRAGRFPVAKRGPLLVGLLGLVLAVGAIGFLVV